MGIGSSIRRAGRRLDRSVSGEVSRAASDVRDNSSRFEGEYRRWGRQADPYWKYAAYGWMGSQINVGTREGAKKSGYNKNEAENLGDHFGVNYQSVSASRDARIVSEKVAKDERIFAANLEDERLKARNQIAVRVRRAGRTNQMARTGGVVAGGLGSTGASATFASMLGL